MKTPKNQRKLFASGQQNGSSEKVEKCRNPASLTWTCPSRTFFREVLQVFLFEKAISQNSSDYL